MKILLAVLLVTGSLVAATSTPSGLDAIRKRGELRVGIETGYFPFNIKKPNGEWIGFDADLAKAFAKHLGLAKAKELDVKWEVIIPSLQANKFDILVSAMTITPERANAVNFSDPYITVGLKALLAQKHAGKVKDLPDLDKKGIKIAVQTGTTGEIFAAKTFKNAEIIRMDNYIDPSNAVLFGRMDVFFMDGPYVDIFAKRNAGKVTKLDKEFSSEPLGAAFRKVDTELLAEFNKFLAAYKNSGEHEKSRKEYFETMTWLKEFPDLK